MQFLSIVSALLAAAATASAAPFTPQARDVWAPKITYPHAGTVWKSGQRHNVTWDASNPPKQITNNNGFIVLRSDGVETSVVVAHNFLLTSGRVEVTVPDVITRDDWSLVLFGDSGNWSDDFTIDGVIDF